MNRSRLFIICSFFIISVALVGCSSGKSSVPSASNSAAAVSIGVTSTDMILNEPNADFQSKLAEINRSEEVVQFTVNGQPVYTKTVLAAKLADANAVETALKQIDAMDISEQEKAQMREPYQIKSEEQIIHQIIANIVQDQEAKRRGIDVSLEETYHRLKSDYNAVKDAAENGEGNEKRNAQTSLNDIQAYIDGMGYESLEEYFHATAEGLLEPARISKLRSEILAGFSEEQKQDEEGSYQKLIDDLIAKAEVVQAK